MNPKTETAPESIIALARKIAALAERGIDGERNAAQEKLDALLEKHKLSITDISPDIRARVRFRVSGLEEIGLLAQIYCMVCRKRTMPFSRVASNRSVYLVVNPAEADDIQRIFRHYSKIYRREKRRLVRDFGEAFYSKYNICSGLPPEGDGQQGADFDDDKALRIAMLRRAIRGDEYKRPAKMIERVGGRA